MRDGIAKYPPVRLPFWHYMTGTTVAGNDASQQVVVPSDATIIQISAEGGAAYYAINADFAQANSPGYCPEDQLRIEGPIGNLVNLYVFAATGVSVHIMFFREG